MSRALQAEPKYTQNGETVSPAPKWCLQAVSAPRPQGTYWPLSCGVEHLFVSVLAASRACGERGEIQNPVMITAGVSPTQELPQPFPREDENQRSLGQEGTEKPSNLFCLHTSSCTSHPNKKLFHFTSLHSGHLLSY